MDNQKKFLTAGAVGIGGVALAYLSHNYLFGSEAVKEGESEMDAAAEKVNNGSFLSFLFSSDDSNKSDAEKSVEDNTEVKQDNVVVEKATDNSVKSSVEKTVSAFGGFFTKESPSTTQVLEESA